MKLYLVRHGESEANVGHYCQAPDTKLTQIGLSQAKLVAHRFKTIPIDIILTSKYFRTQQTAKAIVDATDVPMEVHPLLHEQIRPTKLYGKPHTSPEFQRYLKLRNQHLHDKKWHFADEENHFDHARRINRLLKSLTQRPESSICAVTHGNTLRAIITSMLFGVNPTHQEIDRLWKLLQTSNTGITYCEYNHHRQDNRWLLVSWNDHAHLG
jgi:probable phosphoglycerate mutase